MKYINIVDYFYFQVESLSLICCLFEIFEFLIFDLVFYIKLFFPK